MPRAGRLRYLDAPPTETARPNGTLVLIHGFPLSARMWEPQLALARQGWRVIAPELRGMGEDASDPPAASMDDFAADIVDLLDALHVKEAVIGGLSMGGYVTFALFRLAPRYFRAIVLADTRPQADTPEAVDGRRRMLATLEAQGPAGVADEMLPMLLGPTTRRDRPEVVDLVRGMVLSNAPAGIGGAIRALMSRPDSTPTLAAIHCPALILVGEEDALTPPALSREMHAAIAGSDLEVIPMAGHLPNLEAPAAFNAAFSHFLDRRV